MCEGADAIVRLHCIASWRRVSSALAFVCAQAKLLDMQELRLIAENDKVTPRCSTSCARAHSGWVFMHALSA